MNAYRRTISKQFRKKSRVGVALLITVSMVAVFSLLCLSMISFTSVNEASIKVHYERSIAYYELESAASKSFWEIRKFKQMNQGLSRQSDLSDADDQWHADGKKRLIKTDDYAIEIRLYNANSGLSLLGTNPGEKMKAYFKTNQNAAFFNQLDDYIDGDDLVRLNGLEKGSYKSEHLPANKALQYREEIIWLPSYKKLTKDIELEDFSIIPPGRYKMDQKISFFAASDFLLKESLSLTDSELDQLKQAKQDYYDNGRPLNESLGVLYQAVSQQFSLRESSIFKLELKYNHSSGIGRILTLVFDLKGIDRANTLIEYWQRDFK